MQDASSSPSGHDARATGGTAWRLAALSLIVLAFGAALFGVGPERCGSLKRREGFRSEALPALRHEATTMRCDPCGFDPRAGEGDIRLFTFGTRHVWACENCEQEARAAMLRSGTLVYGGDGATPVRLMSDSERHA